MMRPNHILHFLNKIPDYNMADVRVLPSYGDLECRSSVTVKMKWESTSSNSRNMIKKEGTKPEKGLEFHFLGLAF